MTTLEIVVLIFAILAVIAGITTLIVYFIGRNNQQPPLATFHGTQNLEVNPGIQSVPVTYITNVYPGNQQQQQNVQPAQNNNRNRLWIIPLLIVGVIIATVGIVLLLNKDSKPDPIMEKLAALEQTVNLTKDQVENNLTVSNTTKSTADQVLTNTGKLLNDTDTIKTATKNIGKGVEKNGKNINYWGKKNSDLNQENGAKLDSISQQISDLNADITLLRSELNIYVAELKDLLANNASTDDIKSITDEINNLRLEIENLEKQKQQIGDPD